MPTPLVENFAELTKEELLGVRIEDCQIKRRAKSVLLDPRRYVGENEGWKRRRWYEGHPELFEVVETIGDLINRNSMEVLARPGCGRKTLNELRDGLRAMNLHFRNEVRP